jgi:cytochrome c oxidase assembly protein subunit 15
MKDPTSHEVSERRDRSGQSFVRHRTSNPSDSPYPGSGHHRTLIGWLLGVAGLVFLIVVVGGITRLTESGLSITEWKPVTGVLPPLSERAWEAEFEKYQRIPQYLEIKAPAGMTLRDFKFIYFWEWLHRLLGRIVGLAFALPLLAFWSRKSIPSSFKPRLLILLGLVGLQGIVGWWMVASGLVGRTDVSHYRLAVHLLLALVILGGLVWTALDFHLLEKNPAATARPTRLGFAAMLILSIELLLGAFTAGLNAGYVSNTWPLMYGRFFPPGIEWSVEMLKTLPDHPVLIHFLHRWWAWVVVIVLTLLARRVRADQRRASVALHCAFGTQIILGIATVLTGVNLTLAVLHQAVGALVVATTVWCVHLDGRRAPSPPSAPAGRACQSDRRRILHSQKARSARKHSSSTSAPPSRSAPLRQK